MTPEEVKTVKTGLYRIYWKDSSGGGSSLASVGVNPAGDLWFAPINWTEVPSFDWSSVQRAECLVK